MSPLTLFIEAKDFHNAWARAVRAVIRSGEKLTIGDASEPKPIRDSCGLITLSGNAIKQIENREIHQDYPFKHIKQYCKEFTREYLATYADKPPSEQFSYLYFERLTAWAGDQIQMVSNGLKYQIESGLSSNRNQAVTWDHVADMGSKSPPCLQRVWVRYLGNKEVEVHLTWRSRDLYTAWQSNIIALIDMVNREIVIPNGCKIVKIVDFSDSLHIYDGDAEAAAQVKLVPENPQWS